MIPILLVLFLISFSPTDSEFIDEELPNYILDLGHPVTISRIPRDIEIFDDSEEFGDCDGEQPNGEIGIRNTIINERFRWYSLRNGTFVVLIYIDPEFGPKDENLIKESMMEIQEKTCITFYLYSNRDILIMKGWDYIHIVKGRGCSSSIGRQRRGSQKLNLGPGCVQKSTIIHELFHAIGLKHEHTRSDRDKYITINWENIEPGKSFNFDKVNQAQYTHFDAEYDYKSIMHYRDRTFSVNGNQTITAKNGVRIQRNFEMGYL